VRAWAARWHARVEGGTDALAETASMHPDPRRAAALRAEVEATVTGPDGPLAVDAADRWARAASTWTAAGRPWEAAWAGLAEAEACFAARDTARGRAALAGVVSVADELGAHPLRTHADTLARRARLRSVEPAPRRSDPDLPTPREHDVLVLMADGLTNPQIAQRLFLSPKTVGIHVSRLLAKLDAHTRGEAVAVARRRGLLD
jgi:DNA-binding CsgD family transcriptional regulator